QGGHDLCSQAVSLRLRDRRQLAAGIEVSADPVRSFVARLTRVQQAECHKIGQLPARRAWRKAQPSKDSLVDVVAGAGDGYGGYLGVRQARGVHALAQGAQELR